ncbi:hypothetical protein GYMC52_0430 [Geobacillus sp. Y412MC52]|nr:hypothetical protein GYMC52_0430 [Geobacillus sp. Y412MC52]
MRGRKGEKRSRSSLFLKLETSQSQREVKRKIENIERLVNEFSYEPKM